MNLYSQTVNTFTKLDINTVLQSCTFERIRYSFIFFALFLYGLLFCCFLWMAFVTVCVAVVINPIGSLVCSLIFWFGPEEYRLCLGLLGYLSTFLILALYGYCVQIYLKKEDKTDEVNTM